MDGARSRGARRVKLGDKQPDRGSFTARRRAEPGGRGRDPCARGGAREGRGVYFATGRSRDAPRDPFAFVAGRWTILTVAIRIQVLSAFISSCLAQQLLALAPRLLVLSLVLLDPIRLHSTLGITAFAPTSGESWVFLWDRFARTARG